MLRTVNYKNDVIGGIAALLGIDSTIDLSPVRANQWADRINARVKEGWRFWDWPELRYTDERAFRIIWNSTKQFKKVSTMDPVRLGLPDQLFYIPTFSYYQVLATAPSDPPVGTLPTNTTYFAPLTNYDQYIDIDQPCRRAIGEVLGVYNGDPRTNGGAGAFGLPFRLSERGIELSPSNLAGASVFLSYKISPSKFTNTAWNSAANYNKGDRVYYTDGNVYRAVQFNSNIVPTTVAYWAVVPFPERIAEFVKCAVAADVADDLQTTGKLLAQADEQLKGEADSIIAQGNVNFYQATDRRRRIWIPLGTAGFWWSVSAPWSGSTSAVTTLTDTCEFDLY